MRGRDEMSKNEPKRAFYRPWAAGAPFRATGDPIRAAGHLKKKKKNPLFSPLLELRGVFGNFSIATAIDRSSQVRTSLDP